MFEGDRLIVKQRVVGPRKEIKKTAALEAHELWVKENVPAYGVMPDRPRLVELWQRLTSTEKERSERGKLDIQTVRQHASNWKHLKPLGDLRIPEITSAAIEARFDEMELASKTKSHVRQLLRILLRSGGSTQALDDAGMRFEKAPKGPTLERSAIRAIIAKLPTDHDVLIFQVGITLGMRAAEIARLTAWHVREPGWIHVPGTKTALSKSRLPLLPELGVPLAKLAAAAISPQQRLLFTQQTHRQWLEEVLQPTALEAIERKVDMLELRRTALTRSAKIDESGASRMARHTTTRMIREVYDSAPDDRVLAMQVKLWAELAGEQRVE